jgi:hypothetical protein
MASSNSTKTFMKEVVPVRAIVKNPSQFKNAALTLDQLRLKGIIDDRNLIYKRPSSLFRFPMHERGV